MTTDPNAIESILAPDFGTNTQYTAARLGRLLGQLDALRLNIRRSGWVQEDELSGPSRSVLAAAATFAVLVGHDVPHAPHHADPEMVGVRPMLYMIAYALHGAIGLDGSTYPSMSPGDAAGNAEALTVEAMRKVHAALQRLEGSPLHVAR